MTLYFDNERLERALLATFQSELSTALDTIETRWSSIDPVTLPDVVTYGEPGHNPNAIEQSIDYYPYLEVLAGSREPGARADQQGWQEQNVPVTISYVVVADTEATINKIAKRYAEAIDLVLQSNSKIEAATRRNFKQSDMTPNVTLSLPGRYSVQDTVGRQGGDMFSTQHEKWMIAGSFEITLNG